VPGSDIVIRDNVLRANDEGTHGIYMGNQAASGDGSTSNYYRGVVIENNIISSGQELGIAVGETLGLVVRNNVVLQHSGVNSSLKVKIPVILFDDDARDVSITGNTTHVMPFAADYWSATGAKNSSWTISGNKIVARGSTPPRAGDSPSPTPPAGAGDGDADTFRFDGDALGSGRVVSTIKNLHFGEGDVLVFIRYDRDTFDHVADGNSLQVSADGTYARIDSIADLKELAQASSAVTLSGSPATGAATIEIDHGDTTHLISLQGLADALL
jgi:hypothetical protein